MDLIQKIEKGIMGGALLFLCWTAVGLAEEEAKPKFEGAVFYGGAGDQGAAQGSMGMAVTGNRIYLSGVDKVVGGQGLAVCAEAPLSDTPVWMFRWPNVQAGGQSWNDQALRDVAVTSEGIYYAGSVYLKSVGSIEAVVAKFPFSGATGGGLGGALWVAKPRFFSYGWITMFHGVIHVQEGDQTFLYATGHSQSDGSNNTAVLAKIDTAGNILWTKVLGDPKSYQWSQGDSLVSLNGSIYVVGYVHYPSNSSTIRPHAGIWKVSPSGDVVWVRTSSQPIPQNAGLPLSAATEGNSLYVACGRENGSQGGSDALLLKYDQTGNLLWSKEWGGPKDDVATGIAASGNRLYLVGETASFGSGAKDLFLLQADAATGEILSELTYGGAGDDVGRSVKVAGKDLYVLGETKSFTQGGNGTGQCDMLLLRYVVKPYISTLTVPIDIKPGEKAPNPINLKVKGKIPVAILSTKEFDAPAVADQASLTFGRTGSEQSLTTQPCGVEDVNHDGLPDLVAHFENQLTGFQVGDTSGILRGKTLKGIPFQGIDLIQIVPPKVEKEKRQEPEKPVVSPPVRTRPIEKPAVPPKVARREVKAPAQGSAAPSREEAKRLKQEAGVAY